MASGGYKVVAEELTGLAGYLQDESATTTHDVRSAIADLHLTGDKTGRCCPEAGDAVQKALDALGENVRQFSTCLSDIGGVLEATARRYRSADDGGADGLRGLPGDA